MAQNVKRAFKYRFYPTPAQGEELARTFGCVRLIYNKTLAERTRAYRAGRKMSYADTSAMLTSWKRAPELGYLAEVSCVPLQQALRHLQRAFVNYFAKRAGYPKFKSRKRGRASAEYMRSAFTYRDQTLRLAKMAEPLKIAWSRPLPRGVEPTTVTVSRDPAGRWFVSILCEDEIPPLMANGEAVGVDLGITNFAALSSGEVVANPRNERRARRRLVKAQKNLARKQMGSANWSKARLHVARVHARISDRRRDFLHKLSTRLVRENQTVVDRWLPSTKLCSTCGAIRGDMPLRVRRWTCLCGISHDRDVNAAKNILAAGLAER
jgi:putative transposase